MTKRRINGRQKGASGEREAATWLYERFQLANIPQRNLEQVREGGYDLVGFAPFAFEVKRCEVLALRDWWLQAVYQCDAGDIPVVMYRQNRKKWRFLVSAGYIGVEKGYVILEIREFLIWAANIIKGDTSE